MGRVTCACLDRRTAIGRVLPWKTPPVSGGTCGTCGAYVSYMIKLASLLLATLLAGCTVEHAPVEDAEDAEMEIVANPRAKLQTARFEVAKSALQPAKAAFVSHADYVAANVPVGPATALRAALEAVLDGPLKNRGEAHVTTITPGEMGKLGGKLSNREIEDIAVRSGVQRAVLTPKCVGMGETSSSKTFYLVVESSDLLAVRSAVAAAFVAKGGDRGAFDPQAFHPHVTLGFTKRDLHESDGVVKSTASCPNPAGLVVQP